MVLPGRLISREIESGNGCEIFWIFPPMTAGFSSSRTCERCSSDIAKDGYDLSLEKTERSFGSSVFLIKFLGRGQENGIPHVIGEFTQPQDIY